LKKIDKDNNGLLTEEELRDWVDYIHSKYEWDETDRQMKDHDLDHNGKLTWPEYLEAAYGHDNEAEFDHRTDFDYKTRIRRDRRRWDKADENGDKELTRNEFHSFLHPTEAEHMKDLYIEETMEDMDKDKDGYVSLEEYINDIYHPPEGKGKDTEEPDWVKSRRAHFNVYQDKNNDGKMDKAELRLWMLPQNYSYGEAEAKHLMYQVDSNEDGNLTDTEIINKYDVFVGSHATHFGKVLYNHDEL
jgi:Ca2+-binding EF-hand superfamily protein